MTPPHTPSHALRPSLNQNELDTIVAVLRADTLTHVAATIETLQNAGISAIELTLTTPGILEHIATLHDRLAPTTRLGVGTVTTTAQVAEAAAAGAEFLVSPNTNERVLAAARAHEIPMIPGGFTPSELALGQEHGCGTVKLFPASTVGPGYLRQLHGPYPGLRVLPSGGISIATVGDWVSAGSSGVSIGGPLLGDALSGGSLEELTTRARAAVTAFTSATARYAQRHSAQHSNTGGAHEGGAL